MKKLLLAICSLAFVIVSCHKNTDCTAKVTITDSAPGCGGWGIIVNGVTYPSATIPSAFQRTGFTVCADYELYEDRTVCACCGGTWAKINSMSFLPD